MLKEYENQNFVSSQEYFIERLKRIFSIIYPSVDKEKLEGMMTQSMDWVENINWERLKEEMVPFLNNGGLKPLEKIFILNVKRKEGGGCYYLIRNTGPGEKRIKYVVLVNGSVG